VTINITILTVPRVIQTSDRRISFYRAGRFGVLDDDRNKAVVVHNKLVHFSAAYCGLAEVEGVRTDRMMGQLFAASAVSARSPRQYFDDFAKAFAARFNELTDRARVSSSLRRTSISAAGYLLRNGEPFTVLISNYEDLQGNQRSPDGRFLVHPRVISAPTYRQKNRAACIAISGPPLQLGRIVLKKLSDLQRRRFFHRVGAPYAADYLARMVREIASSPSAQNLIGSTCVTTVLNRPPAHIHEFFYHSASGSRTMHGPDFVFGTSIATDFYVRPIEK
jgi:hypothetical protein